MSHPTPKSLLRDTVAGITHGTGPVRLLEAEGAFASAAPKESFGTKAAGFAAPRPQPACRYSYEDYKHHQAMEWLERGSERGGGRQVSHWALATDSCSATNSNNRNEQVSERALVCRVMQLVDLACCPRIDCKHKNDAGSEHEIAEARAW